MRRLLILLIFSATLAGMIVAVVHRDADAYSCNLGAGGCGYFTDSFASADWNVLPDPALQGVNSSTELINAIHWYLFTSTSYQAHVGAAFIIDNMLNYRGTTGVPVGGGVSAGITYAKNNYNTWVDLINFYASPKSSSYGIQWSYWPSESTFCGSGGKVDSGYDPVRGDAVFYRMPAYGTFNCDYEYTHSMPEIRFFWPGGTFDIGTLCGNIQDSANKIPPPDEMPIATIVINCASGAQQATVNFSDPDGATTGYITINGYTSPSVSSGGNRTIGIPTSYTTPYTQQNVYLHVKDVGTVAPPNTYAIFQAQTDVPCATFGCGSLDLTPDRLDPYMTNFTLGVSVVAQNGVPAPAGATLSIQVTPPAGATYSFAGSHAANVSGSVASYTFTVPGPTTKTGLYTVSWTLTGSGVNQTCPGSFPVVFLPYLNVYGGDVLVGSSPAYSGGASACALNSSSGIFGWNSRSAGYPGAGAQYAVLTLGTITTPLAGQIEDFASALGSTNTPPIGLSFANTYTPVDNTKINTSLGMFGGYGGMVTSDCDFTSDLTTAPTNTDLTLAGHSVAAGTKETQYVTGHDVYISGNISYASTGGWTGASQIPYFKLVVAGGDIYISNTVTQLDGVYVAESSGGAGGRIFTCASAIRGPINPAVAGYYATCNQKLVINGVFVARQVRFLRTNGSLGQARNTDNVNSNHSAEVFNYTPEVWLPRGANITGSGYTAITGLPPVL